jgi:hypothetical protein
MGPSIIMMVLVRVVIVLVPVVVVPTVRIVMVVILARIHPAAAADATQLAPAVLGGFAVGAPTMAAPIAGLKVPAVTAATPVVFAPVNVTTVVALLEAHRAGGDSGGGGQKKECGGETHFYLNPLLSH